MTFSNTTLWFQQVKVVHYNDTPIPDTVVYLFRGGTWSSHLLQSLTTDSYGVATFSFNTSTLNGDITLRVSEIILNVCP